MGCPGEWVVFLSLANGCPSDWVVFLVWPMGCPGEWVVFLSMANGCPGEWVVFLSLANGCLGEWVVFLSLVNGCPGLRKTTHSPGHPLARLRKRPTHPDTHWPDKEDSHTLHCCCSGDANKIRKLFVYLIDMHGIT